jgi:Fe-S cluster assembly protein SufD
MEATTLLQNAFEKQINNSDSLGVFHADNWKNYASWGLPAIKHEEWKYARIKNVFNDKMILSDATSINAENITPHLLKGNLSNNAIFFINGIYNATLSSISESATTIEVKSLAVAAEDEDAAFVKAHLGHSQKYHPDGINALNAAFASSGVYIKIKKGKKVEQPVVVYHITDTTAGFMFSQPRILVNAEAASEVVLLETYIRLGSNESLTNEVFEICAAKDAIVNYIKITSIISTR